jgi:hypothetical protein
LMLEFRHTNNVIVSVIEIVIATMCKALMPEKSIGAHGKAVQEEFALDGGGGTIEIRCKRTEWDVRWSHGRRGNIVAI